MSYLKITRALSSLNPLAGRTSLAAPLVFGAVISLAVLPNLGCQSAPKTVDPNQSPIEATTNAYRDYERGDCQRVEQQADSKQVQQWESTEVRHSMVLVRGFCQERAGDLDAAQETYRELIQDAPHSFASDDARERLRVLRLIDRDPDFRAWVEGAKSRIQKSRGVRMPVDRIPADFPPLPHQAEIEGYAIVEFGITPRGDTDSPVIVESEPPLLFDGAALRAVREWRYTKDPESTESHRQVIRIVFRPMDSEPTLEEENPTSSPSATTPARSIQ